MAVLFVIAKKWKQQRHLSPDKRINKMQSIHIIEYYSAINSTNTATTWVNPENIMLSERSQAQTTTYGMILFT